MLSLHILSLQCNFLQVLYISVQVTDSSIHRDVHLNSIRIRTTQLKFMSQRKIHANMSSGIPEFLLCRQTVMQVYSDKNV